jgi:hypothetical protein
MVVVISTEDKPQEVDDLIYAVEYPGIVRTPKNDFAKFRIRRLICRICKLKFRTRQETQEHIRHEHRRG